MDKIVECVPNFSEGRDKSVINAISGAIESVEGVRLLDVDPGADFNRTVFTFVGDPESVLEAAFAAAKVGTSLIDMREHSGEHARMGAMDVVPFIPIKGVTMEDCTELAKRFGKKIAAELGIPMFLYAKSATKPERVRLPDIRKGEYEALPEKFKDTTFKPDFGEPVYVPKSGATATGARPILIAYNINLNTSDKKIASKIAGRIRTSGTVKRDENGEKIIGPDGKAERIPGLFKGIQAGGMMYNEDIAQVSMNILDYSVTGMHELYEASKNEAKKFDAEVTGSEIVGLVPLEALTDAGRYYAEEEGKKTDAEQELLQLAIEKLGLNQLYDFRPKEKIIDYLVSEEEELVSKTLKDFLDELSSKSPAPGGGSVAALSGSLGAGLLEMVGNLTVGKEKYRDNWDDMQKVIDTCSTSGSRLLDLVDEDTNAFNDVIKAFRMPKETEEQKGKRSQAIQKGYKKAIETPLDTAKQCMKVLEMAPLTADKGNPNSVSDAGVGADMAAAGLRGAIMNIEINLGSIKDQDYVDNMKEEIKQLHEEGENILKKVREEVEKKL